jgi:hypothetical protein
MAAIQRKDENQTEASLTSVVTMLIMYAYNRLSLMVVAT